jgi:hypothetical protein
MDLIEHIGQQMNATKLPLVGITVAAVACPETPIILTLHWHGFMREKLADIDAAQPVRYTSVPSSAVQINKRWDDVLDLDRAALDAGWALGAWDVARHERVGCLRPGAPTREAIECLQAFGATPYNINGQPAVLAEAPDSDELLNLAARRGYLMWSFRPVHGGIWRDADDDETLREDGTRELPCPTLAVPPKLQGAGRTVYQFGRSSRLLS